MRAEYIDHMGDDLAVVNASPHNLAWAAGIIEGEGCFSHYQRSNRPSTGAAIHCEMTDEDTIRTLHKVLGVGKVSRRPARARRKPTWILSIQKNGEIFDTLLRLSPYLMSRRKLQAAKLFKSLEPKVCAQNT